MKSRALLWVGGTLLLLVSLSGGVALQWGVDIVGSVFSKTARQSPVRIMGGSIRFHARGKGWATQIVSKSIQTVDQNLKLSRINFDDECVSPPNQPSPNPISTPWKMTIYARTQDKAKVTVSDNGVVVCSNYSAGIDCDPAATVLGTSVTIVTTGKGKINPLPPPDDGKTN